MLTQIYDLGSPTMAELANSLLMDLSATRHSLGPLIRDRTVRLRVDPKDHRVKRATLTPTGVAKFKEANQLWRKAQDRFEHALSPARAATSALSAVACQIRNLSRGGKSLNKRNTVMTIRYVAICTATFLAAVALQGTSAHALSMRECSAKYKAAKDAGTLNGMKWNDFRKAQCGAEATAAPAPATAQPTPTTAAKPTSAPKPAPAATGNAVFPSAVSSKYSSESAGKARMHTCLDQYNTNKANNGNGGLRWIEKGGGYYSECNKHLKG